MKLAKPTAVKVHHKLDDTLETEAVTNLLAGGNSTEVIAKELRPAVGLIYAWKVVPYPRRPPDPERRPVEAGQLAQSSAYYQLNTILFHA